VFLRGEGKVRSLIDRVLGVNLRVERTLSV
jgi:hypothetical protein